MTKRERIEEILRYYSDHPDNYCISFEESINKILEITKPKPRKLSEEKIHKLSRVFHIPKEITSLQWINNLIEQGEDIWEDEK